MGLGEGAEFVEGGGGGEGAFGENFYQLLAS
jgi:hypothetical protein